MILDELKKQDGRPRLARWASVSQELKAVFEPHIFKTLTVQFPGSDIETLDQFVDGYRRDFVKRISLHVKTAEDDVKEEYDKVETYKTKRENNKTFAQALQHLFSVLSTWSCSTFAKGIALELSASSPSDVDHPYQHRHNQSQHDLSRIYSLNSRRGDA
ncbi:uncharacterized protein CTRU02_215342 [Colletotrichum truncatum]|uniref:Uncharacterized protein n=1 Tax=Colletotrichum truncatum TaxID=5467 RepID=A0ACC3YCY1_COLTU|nr:uncharacterized protein CTRU02_13298 [Colletotrichum truncatum]KAF6783535.1 hypothetical protein CTRU02_13298 [Colletotrichum truncatum]